MAIKFIHIPKNAGTSIREIIENTREIEYAYHSTDVFALGPEQETIVVLREPIDRFCSAVRHAVQKYPHEVHVKTLIELELASPNVVAEILSQQNHIHYRYVKDFVKSDTHKVGKRELEMNWTFSPQYLWINNPTYVLLFENLDYELSLLLESFGYKSAPVKRNVTVKSCEEKLSKKAMPYLQELYKVDFELWEKYRNTPLHRRLNLV